MSPATATHPTIVDERGFTLVEVLVAIPIGLVLFGAVLMLSGVFSGNEQTNAGRTESIEAGQIALARMTREIRQGSAVRPASGTASVIEIDTYVDGAPAEVEYDCSSNVCKRSSPPGATPTTVVRVADPDVFTMSEGYVELTAKLPVAGASRPIVVTDGAALANVGVQP